jgi:sulfite reductase (ferredoxin)
VNRNVMCCPAPFKNDPIRREMQALALYLADLLKPKTESYSELWLTDPDTGEKTNILPSSKPMEPLYGELYMPRKFKVGIAKCDDNCIDVYDQDVGLLAISDGSKLIGYNVLAGGGMGTKPSDQRCFPALAKRLTFVTPEQVPVVVAAILLTQRDHGNRSDRKQARMKYLIHRWGLERFREAVQSRLVEAASIIGASENETPNTLPDPNPADVFFSDDHLGWFEQGDGKWFLGLPIESGRVKDSGKTRLKSALRSLFEQFQFPAAITAQQNLLITEVPSTARTEIEDLLKLHGVPLAEQLTPVRRQSFACPALPTCGLALTESERALPAVLEQLEGVLEDLGLLDLHLDVRMTGCPNGCARPYNAEVGLVGSGHDLKSGQGKYTLFLGGSRRGNRMNEVYEEKVLRDDIAVQLRPLLRYFKGTRTANESFGDFCHRVGMKSLHSKNETPAGTQG